MSDGRGETDGVRRVYMKKEGLGVESQSKTPLGLVPLEKGIIISRLVSSFFVASRRLPVLN